MARKKSDTPEASAFGMTLSQYIDQYAVNQSQLAERLGTSRAYVSGLATGKKHASAKTAEEIARTLGVSEEETVRLHRAAAADAGFKLDLPEDF